jgi:hypothetical protein
MATVSHIIRVPLDGTTMTAEMNIEIVYTREWHLRMWLGKRLLHMAAWVLGCNFQFPSADEVHPKASE